MKKSGSGNVNGRVQLTGDPRMPEKAKVYIKKVVAPEDAPLDIAGILAMMFGLIGITMKMKLGSWLALIFAGQSLMNARSFDTDLKQVIPAVMFACMGLFNHYFAPVHPAATQR